MPRRFFPLAAVAAIAFAPAAHADDAGQLNVICSVQADWCNMIQTVFAKTTGVKVNMSLKGSGEALAQLIAERANPKTDVWFGGTGDPHLQAAEQGLSLEYKSASLPQLHPWAQQQAAQSGYKTVGIYSGPLGFGYNTELIAKKKVPIPKSWADLLKPAYHGEIQVANPASSGTAYTMVATLVQLMGEDKAFDYLKALHKNVGQYTRSGTGPIKAVARGETAVSISLILERSGASGGTGVSLLDGIW
jgi:iron(III) transport system substrate-binding protein